ncbi:alkyl hydroperoxide reductase [Chryseobacterium sp. MYb264]|uniref:alkyl hydroperoxide reductase n=1 Tax=Chryseobacterium sp. MYb264 TaxID=2745153 RepID=UPI002E1373DF|nr:alkyl hydroperoxide reductase [Chryseobacterium sp. MYb264]
MKKILILLLGIFYMTFNSQVISMNFPQFAGKNYDFILFRGIEMVKMQGTVPADGIFTLQIPKEYEPYTGMCRWLITGTIEGGGLDMLIPGHDFSVFCDEKIPSENTIIYKNNTEIESLNDLFKAQKRIFAKYDAMLQATEAFSERDPVFSFLKKEYEKQVNDNRSFQKKLNERSDYAAKFLRIVNLSRGIGTEFIANEEQKAKNISDYIKTDLDWSALYTSGHWAGIISSWADIHTLVLNDPQQWAADVEIIGQRISDPALCKDFTDNVSTVVNRTEKKEFINMLIPVIEKLRKGKAL